MDETIEFRRIWDVPCGLMDAILTLAFDPGELDNLCSTSGLRVPCRSRVRPLIVRDVVHQACHEQGRLARLIEKSLHLRYADQVEQRCLFGVAEYVRLWFFDDQVPSAGFAGALWAIATDPTHDGLGLAARVGRYVSLEALNGLRHRIEAGVGREGMTVNRSRI